ncbi:MAG: glycosyltransferase family 4 protein, partial [Deltaproteobacteria bacterium]|nr:glycosyltransferase family 4 protein [Deltaproteobacteria bacterium]
MKILFSVDNYDHGSGGAEKSAQTIARALAGRHHSVHVLQGGVGKRDYDDGPVRVHVRELPSPRFIRDRDRDTLYWNKKWRPILEKFLDENPSDLIITQNRLLYGTVDVAQKRGLPVVVFIRAFSMFCPTQFQFSDPFTQCDHQCPECLPLRFRFKWSLIKKNLREYENGLRNATLIFVNSRYMQQVLYRFYDLTAEVVYPVIDRHKYKVDSQARTRVLFVKPQTIKGFSIFQKIAEQMPDTPFMVAGKINRRARWRLQKLKNVACMGWVSDMRQAYAQSRIIIGPSIWPEPFGRVFVEAGLNSIPSVASARGGIPE